jgi:hypothetical protein
MAKSYFGYVERDQEAFVNWASIGTQISKDLEKIRVNRQEQRDELDRVTNEAVTTINELTANQPKLVSEFYMDGANDMRQYLLMLNKEMKAGRLQPSEYMKKKQVLMDGVTQLGDAAKAFATDYEESMKLMQEGKSAGQKIFQDEQYDAFKSTDGKGIYVNPADGRVYIAKRNPDGTINNNPEDLLSVNKLYARRKDIVYKYDVIGEANKNVKVLGDIVKAKRSGNVLTLKDVMQNPEYLKAEGDIINSMMSSPRNVGSILSDYVGGYSFTLKPEEAKGDPNKILLTEDGMGLYMPQLTDAQRKAAEEALRAQLRVQLDRVETPMPIQQPDRAAAASRQQQQRTNAQHLEHLRKLFAGSGTDAVAASDAIRAINPNIKSIQKTDNGMLTIRFNDGRVESSTIPQVGTADASAFEQFITQSGRFLIPGLETQQAFIDWGNSEYSGRSQGYMKAPVDSMGARDPKSSAMTAIADANMTTATFALEQQEALPMVENMVQNLGDEFKLYTVKTTGMLAGDEITITSDDGKSSIQLEFDYQKESQQQGEMQRLMTWLEKEIQKKQAAKTASSPTPEQAAKAASSPTEVEINTTQYN